MTNMSLLLCSSLPELTEFCCSQEHQHSREVLSFFLLCSAFLKQQVVGINIFLWMFVIHWIISYTKCGLATLVTKLFLAQHMYETCLLTHFLSYTVCVHFYKLSIMFLIFMYYGSFPLLPYHNEENVVPLFEKCLQNSSNQYYIWIGLSSSYMMINIYQQIISVL